MLTIHWNGLRDEISTCPVCGTAGLTRRVLQAVLAPAGVEPCTTELLQCPACQARYANPLRPADYEDADRHGLKFYLDQGAGIRTMLEPLALTDERPVRRYLEIGCSFGFVMDYARRILGWQVRGFDPGFIATIGRQQLRLPIENAYFTGLRPGDELSDLVFCSEVIEHIADPGLFLARVRGALEPSGLLLLTTPNGDALAPDLAQDLLLPLLSPGQHVILYNGQAITVLLRQAGFQHIRIVDAGHQLRVAASNVPFVGSSPHFSPALYRRYLKEAAAEFDVADPLGTGLVCRLLKEQVSAGHYVDAQTEYGRLRAGCLRRYGMDIEDTAPDSIRLPPETTHFEELCENWPCNLTGVWYSRGLIQLLHEGRPELAAQSFLAAIQFGSALRGRLHAIGTDDAETAQLCREAELARLHSLARCDPATAVTVLEELTASPAGQDCEIFPAHAAKARRRLFGDLVHLGHYTLAERVLGARELPLVGLDDAESVTTDFACALYLLNHAGHFRRAAAVLEELRKRVGHRASSTGENDARKHFQEIEIAWILALARFDAPNAAMALGHVSDNLAGLDAELLIAHRDRAASRLFTDLVNLGCYEVAEEVLESSLDPENNANFQAGDAAFTWGIYLLNYRTDYAHAATVFTRVWQQAHEVGDNRRLLWAARFHQGLASRYQGDSRLAALIAAEIRRPAPDAPPVPEEFQARLGELSPPA